MSSDAKEKARAEVRRAQVEFESNVGKRRLESAASIAAALESMMKV